jgi:hypothetical protein
MDGEEAGGSEGDEESDMSEIEYDDDTGIRKIRCGKWSEGEIKRFIASAKKHGKHLEKNQRDIGTRTICSVNGFWGNNQKKYGLEINVILGKTVKPKNIEKPAPEGGLEKGRGKESEKVEMDGEEAGGSEGDEESDMSEIEYDDDTGIRKIRLG